MQKPSKPSAIDQSQRARLSTDPYKGVRDFYPEDQFIQRYLFEHMERVCELFGYEEYNASVLEPAELYRSKTSAEIVNDQTYTFTDRGDREVTLRPEMTPTFARMVAARSREIPLPARWYTIANVFRYERPQKGRLREHWQLNADIVGVAGIEADAEIIAMAHAIMRSMGAEERDFEIRVSDRRILDAMYDSAGIDIDTRSDVTRLLDRRAKLEDFDTQLAAVVGGTEKAQALISEIERTTSTAYLEELRVALEHMGVTNMIVDTKITRGFDYYTGMVFEVFDTSPENRRSLFGGGRYDNLLTLFGGDSIPAVGFGMGDVTARDFLEAHNLLPAYAPASELMICIVEPEATSHATRLAQDLRREDVTVAVNYSGKRLGDQIRQAEKMKVPFVIAVGAKERDSGRYTIKNLATGNETVLTADRISEHLFSSLG
ncbi:MAG: hisS [Candidatus Kaiserbacteria bacterium]|nr:hisS [Candidatus Kaiserbacteria bacterium]